MKRFSLMILAAVLFANIASAQKYQSGNEGFSLKVQPFVGHYLSPNGNLTKINPTFPTGVNFGYELLPSKKYPWQQYLNNSTMGVGVSYIDLGDKVMGHAVSMYPYIMLNCVRTKHFELAIKLASGLAWCSEDYYTNTQGTNHGDVTAHYTFGSHLNAYLCGGVNLNFPLTSNLTLNGELGFFHMSNGRIMEPNMGANVLYGGVGLIATLNPQEEELEAAVKFPSLPYRWSLNVTLSAGAHSADLNDEHVFLINTFHLGAIYNVCNWYGIGLGADVFYNDAIGAETNRGLFRTDIDYKQSDKIRAGVSINNELQFGRVTAMVDWGVYLYNPARNYYASKHPIYGHGERPLFYKGERAGADEAWHYIRFGVKCRVWDNIYVQALAKTHLHIAEMIEFGVGYSIPFLKKSKRNDNKDIMFHYTKEWWKNY